MKNPIIYLTAIAILAVAALAPAQLDEPVEVGLEEQTGKYMPLDLPFVDEQGKDVTLGEMVDKPTILCLVYYNCPSICSPLLNGVGEVIDTMDLKPGIDYNVVTISFDETDKPDVASQKKRNFMEVLDREIPERSWRFLTGKQASIDTVTNAVGFRYTKEGKDFNHPGLITILSESGQITRYIRGISFVPADVEMALVEASRGRVGTSRLEATKANRFLAFCFAYDPDSNSYVPNVMRIVGIFTVVMAIFFIGLVVLIGRSTESKTDVAKKTESETTP